MCTNFRNIGKVCLLVQTVRSNPGEAVASRHVLIEGTEIKGLSDVIRDGQKLIFLGIP
jgi:hypothetical protein